MAPDFDRAREDLGNIVLLEHVNVTIPDQRLATIFYVSGLGLTRDPYLMTGIDNMWVNVGRSQFHLPSRGTQVLRGRVGIVVPDLAALTHRLQNVAPLLAETRFAWEKRDGCVEATCPWGNRYRCHGPAPEFGDTELAIAYVELDVPGGSAPGIARQRTISTAVRESTCRATMRDDPVSRWIPAPTASARPTRHPAATRTSVTPPSLVI